MNIPAHVVNEFELKNVDWTKINELSDEALDATLEGVHSVVGQLGWEVEEAERALSAKKRRLLDHRIYLDLVEREAAKRGMSLGKKTLPPLENVKPIIGEYDRDRDLETIRWRNS